jgi:probable HAF family extracellular repeat protein
MIRKRNIVGATLAALALGASVAARPAAASSYTITDLGIFSGGYRSYAQGINGLGYVVGEADIARVYTAFLYTGTGLQNLGRWAAAPAMPAGSTTPASSSATR